MCMAASPSVFQCECKHQVCPSATPNCPQAVLTDIFRQSEEDGEGEGELGGSLSESWEVGS